MEDSSRSGDETLAGRVAGSPLQSGVEFAGHRIESEMGRGGMGVVYRALHLALDRERAIKVIAPSLSADERFRRRFEREARLAARLDHPNVIPVHGAGEEGGLLYLAMRLVDGDDLGSLVRARGPLDLGRTTTVISAVAAGLDAAHAAGLVHRDIKPANILLEGEGPGARVFVSDFGISRATTGTQTASTTGELLGSVDYVAPEQAEGREVDARTDVYALGGVLHYALTGEQPFPRDTDMAKLFAHANAARPRPSVLVDGLPAAVDDVVDRAMAVAPGDRYLSAGELAADLERIAAASPSGTRPAPSATAPEPTTERLPGKSRRVPILLALVALAAVAVVAVLLATRGDDESTGSAAQPVGKVTATIPVSDGPLGVAIGDKDAWVAARDGTALDVIDVATERPARSPVQLSSAPASVAVGFGSVWVAESDANTVVRLDPIEGIPPRTIAVGEHPSDVTVGDQWVWVANEDSDSVSRIDPATNAVDRTVPVGDSPHAIAVGESSVWVTNLGGQSVSQIDPHTAKTVGTPIPAGQRPNDVAVGGGSVWVIDNFAGTLLQIDPATAKAGEPIEVGSHPRGVKFGLGGAWVANGGDGTVVRVDPRAGEVAGAPVKVGKDPADLAIGHGSVWTADFGDSTLTRIKPH